MGRDWFEFVGLVGAEIIKKWFQDGFSLEGSGHMRLKGNVLRFQWLSKNSGMRCGLSLHGSRQLARRNQQRSLECVCLLLVGSVVSDGHHCHQEEIICALVGTLWLELEVGSRHVAAQG